MLSSLCALIEKFFAGWFQLWFLVGKYAFHSVTFLKSMQIVCFSLLNKYLYWDPHNFQPTVVWGGGGGLSLRCTINGYFTIFKNLNRFTSQVAFNEFTISLDLKQPASVVFLFAATFIIMIVYITYVGVLAKSNYFYLELFPYGSRCLMQSNKLTLHAHKSEFLC